MNYKLENHDLYILLLYVCMSFQPLTSVVHLVLLYTIFTLLANKLLFFC